MPKISDRNVQAIIEAAVPETAESFVEGEEMDPQAFGIMTNREEFYRHPRTEEEMTVMPRGIYDRGPSKARRMAAKVDAGDAIIERVRKARRRRSRAATPPEETQAEAGMIDGPADAKEEWTPADTAQALGRMREDAARSLGLAERPERRTGCVEILFHDAPQAQRYDGVVSIVLQPGWLTVHYDGGRTDSFVAANVQRVRHWG